MESEGKRTAPTTNLLLKGNGGSPSTSEFEFVPKTISTYGEESLTSPTLSDKHGSHTVTMTTPRTPVMESHLIAAQAQGSVKDVKLQPAAARSPVHQEETLVAAADTPSAPGMFGWVKGSGLLSRMAEKTRAVTEGVITTLDPQMKDFIHSGGDVQIVVASDKEDKVAPLREAFQNVFGQATVVGLPSRSMTIAEQPVGFASGRQAALERISSLRKCGSVQKDTVVVSVENFLYEVSENLWIDLSCLIISDPMRKIQLQSYSQPTNVSSEQIQVLKESTPSDYPKQWSGFALPIGGVMGKELQVSPSLWQEAVSGLSRRRLLLLAGEGLAGMYKMAIKAKVDDV